MLKINQNIVDDLVEKIESRNNKVSSWSPTTTDVHYPSEKLVKNSLDEKANTSHTHNSRIAYGKVDNTSTSTQFTATVNGIDELVDGTAVMLENGVVTSAEGFTLNVNNLGAKPIYSNLASATRDTTIFNVNYTMLFVYDSNRVGGGAWICYRGYDANTNTIGYQLRTNSTKFTSTDKGYRYRIWLQTQNGNFMPVNLSTSTDATANRSSAMNTREFIIGGDIRYNSTNGTINANAEMAATTLWQQYTLTLGYSFNNTGKALALTAGDPVYMVATPTSNGNARLTTPYYTQTLPNTEDGKIYILLGYMYSATAMELMLEHPVFEYKNNSVRLYREYYTASETDDLLDDKANATHTHTKSQITDFPTVPSKTSQLTNDSGFLTSHNPVDSTLSSTSANAVQNKVINNALSEKSDVGHTHSQYLTSHQDISGKENLSNKVNSWNSTPNNDNYPTEKLVKDSLDNKVDKETGKGLFSGSYNDLTNKPTIPTQTSQLTNNSGFLTSHQDISGKENTSNKTSSWNSTTNNTRYPTEKLVKDSLDTKASQTDLLNGFQNIGGFSIHTVYSVQGNTSAYDISSGLLYNQQTPVFFLVKNTIGDNQANATMKYYNNGDNIIIKETISTDLLSPISQGIWKKDSWGLFFCVGNSEVQLRAVFSDLENIPTKLSDLTNDMGFLTQHQSLDSKTINITKQATADTGYFATYVISQGGNNLSTKINIPKDFLIKSGSVKTVTTANNPISGYKIGDKYLDLIINAKDSSSTDEHIYILVSDLVDTEITWGNVTGKPTFATVATSGSYNDLTNKPTIPTKTSDLNNDSGFLTSHQDISGKENTSNKTSSWNSTTNNTRYPTEKLVKDSLDSKVDKETGKGLFSGSYNDLSNKPTIPSKTSDLSNDSGFLTSHQDISGKENVSNKTSSWNSTTNDTRYPTEKLVKSSLDSKVDKEAGKGLFSGSYNDLTNKPTIPSKTSDLSNDSGFLTSHQDISGKENTSNKTSSWNSTTNNTRYPTEKLVKDSLDGKVDKETGKGLFSGSYNDLTNKPTIPSKTSDLTNDSGFLTQHQDITGKQDKSNIVTSWNSTTSDNRYPSEKLVKDSLDNKAPYSHSHPELSQRIQNNEQYIGEINYTIDSLEDVAFTGDYNDLINQPNIPTQTSELTNDSGFLTQHQDISGKENVIELITGTHSSTSTYQMTGTSTKNSAINNGTRILYKIPVNSTNTSSLRLNLTLNNNQTTGSKYLRLNGSYVKHNQFNQNDILLLEYDGTYWNIINHFKGLLSDVATSGSYNDLSNKPTIPTTISQLTNDSGYVDNNTLENIVHYQLTSSTYEADITGSFTLTIKVTNIFGQPMVDYKCDSLKEDGYDVRDRNGNEIGQNLVTDSNGECTVSIACYNEYYQKYMDEGYEGVMWGTRNYSIGDANCQVNIDGWKWVFGNANSTYGGKRNKHIGMFMVKAYSLRTASSLTQFGGLDYCESFPPNMPVEMVPNGASDIIFIVDENGRIKFWNKRSSAATVYGEVTWAIKEGY